MAQKRKHGFFLVALSAATLEAAPALGAEGPAPATPAPTWADFHKLQAEVKEQRQLILQLMQSEQQRYDMLLRLIRGQSEGGGQPVLPPAGPSGVAPSGGEGAEKPSLTASAPRAAEPATRTAAIEGKVNLAGAEADEVYVYVGNVRTAPVRGRTVEIKQENKQFIPRAAVVQLGTAVSFPNMDAIFHNVFSNSPRNSFDLGSYRAGDKVRSVVMSAPGVVDIYCNMHQRMSANVLVVPSRLYTKVRPDGTFRLEGVPVGARTVVAWSPGSKPTQQKIELGPRGAQITLDLSAGDAKAHTNKFGQPYGSYKE